MAKKRKTHLSDNVEMASKKQMVKDAIASAGSRARFINETRIGTTTYTIVKKWAFDEAREKESELFPWERMTGDAQASGVRSEVRNARPSTYKRMLEALVRVGEFAGISKLLEFVVETGLPIDLEDEASQTKAQKELKNFVLSVIQRSKSFLRSSSSTTRIGIVEWSSLTPLYEELASRIGRSLFPGTAVLPTKIKSEESLIYDLTTENSPYAFVIGLFETVVRQEKGLGFVPINGWCGSIKGLNLSVDQDAAGTSASWESLCCNQGKFRTITIESEIGDTFIDGPGLLASSNTKIQNSGNISEIVEQIRVNIIDLLPPIEGQKVVLIADQDWCRLIGFHLEKTGINVELLSNDLNCWPEYRIGIAFNENRDQRNLIAQALDEVFSTATIPIAKHYSSVIAKSLFDLDFPAGMGRTTSNAMIPHFFNLQSASLTRAFWSNVATDLVKCVSEREATEELKAIAAAPLIHLKPREEVSGTELSLEAWSNAGARSE